MDVAPEPIPGERPAPPSVDEVAAHFVGPLITVVEQAGLEETAASTVVHTANGHREMESVSLSYVLWRNPLDRADPANLAAISEELQNQLDAEPPWPLPKWLHDMRRLMRYPLLWEAVRTTRLREERDHGAGAARTPHGILHEHINYVIMNSVRDGRVAGEFAGPVLDAVTIDSIEHARILVDGTIVAGLKVSTDHHLVGVAAQLGDRVLSAVIAREHLPFITLEFRTR